MRLAVSQCNTRLAADSRHKSASLVGWRLATIFRRSIVLVPKSVCLCQFLPPFWPPIKAKWTHYCNKPESLNLKTIFQLSFLAGVGTWPRPASSWHSHLSTKQTRPQELLPKYSTFYISLTQYNAMPTLYVLLQSVKGSYPPSPTKYFNFMTLDPTFHSNVWNIYFEVPTKIF